MGQIRTRKLVRNCPCPRKPPIPKTGGPLHVRSWTIPDFPHKRRQFMLREPRRPAPEFDEYYGQRCTDITETQRQVIPLHALHPNLLQAPDPFHNRRVTSVTEYIAHRGKPRTGPLITTEEMPFYGNKGTSITSYLRYVPPAHPAALGGDNVPLPFHGIRATDATSHPKEERLQRAEPTILTYMLPHRPKTAPTVVFPQHVSPAVLVNAIQERRRMFLEKPPASAVPVPQSARVPESNHEQFVCNTARSDTGVTYGDSRARACVHDTFKPDTAPVSARTECTPRSDCAAPPTPRPKTAVDNSRSKAASDDAAKHHVISAKDRPVTAGAVQVSRSHQPGSMSARSETSTCGKVAVNSPGGTPASVSTTPGRSESSRKPCPAELLSKAAQRLGPEKLQRITNWKGLFNEPKPKMAWRC